MSYAELQLASAFSFLRGASLADELAATAASLGLAAIGITDRNTVAGVVRMHAAIKDLRMHAAIKDLRMHQAAKQAGIRLDRKSVV